MLSEEKKQRYVVQAGQGDVYYFYPYTTDLKKIQENSDHAWYHCFVTDYGRISGIHIQDPTDFKSVDGFVIYEGDGLLFKKENFEEMCTVVKMDGSFYGTYQDENNENKTVLMTNEYTYSFEIEEAYDDFDDDACMCCPCCGCTCMVED